jgi:hypothetical protein
MKPGDLVRIGYGLFEQRLVGKIGVIVNVIAWRPGARTAEVLVDGKVRPFYFDYLEPVDETR